MEKVTEKDMVIIIVIVIAIALDNCQDNGRKHKRNKKLCDLKCSSQSINQSTFIVHYWHPELIYII